MNRHDRDEIEDREFPDESDMDDSDEPALVECPNCRKMIVEDTEWCHQCGWYLEREPGSRTPYWVMAIVLAIVLTFLFWRM